MKNRYLILLFIFSTVIPAAGKNFPGLPGIDSPVNGFIDIVVESNVNKVLFSYPVTEANIILFGKIADIRVPVKDFKCTNRVAYRDFISLLKAREFPEITITIPGDIIEKLRNNKTETLHNVLINIAGVEKKYDILYSPEIEKSGESIMTGTILVNLYDINITPPEKYFGMVKIKDKVSVKFGLGFKDISLAHK